MPRKYINVKVYVKSIGKQCLHCGRPAMVRAIDKGTGFRVPVRYCIEHAIEFGAITREEVTTK